ncbi:MAG: hypothetical protein ACJ8OJ_16050 [Povalibacter sp.]
MQIDHKYIDDHHVVPRYLADQLSDAELEAFEAYYLAHPEILKDLEAVARLKTGLSDLQRRGELDGLLRSRKRVWRIAVAAVVAATIIAASMLLVRPVTKRVLLASVPSALTDDAGRPLPVLTKRFVMRLRSNGYDVQLAVPGDRQAIELRIVPEQTAASPYSLEISRIDEAQPPRVVGTLENIAADEDGYVDVYLDSAQLSPGIYELRLRSSDTANSVSVFLLHALSH